MDRQLEEMEMAYNWKSKRAWWEICFLSFVWKELGRKKKQEAWKKSVAQDLLGTVVFFHV